MYGNFSHCEKRNQIVEVAFNSTVWDGLLSVYLFFYYLSNFKLMQEILAYIIVVLAVIFLVKKYFFSAKKNKGCSSDCGC
jgi:hypothetical protein